jgi:hypothetical protein
MGAMAQRWFLAGRAAGLPARGKITHEASKNNQLSQRTGAVTKALEGIRRSAWTPCDQVTG